MPPTPRRLRRVLELGSYERFAEGYFFTAKAMAWFGDA
jgi:hypothetical protein